MPHSSAPPAEFDAPGFVDWFRSVAPYINAFRGRTFVVAFGGGVVAAGKTARPQIEQHVSHNNSEDRDHHGIRLTDTETMQCVKEAVGRVRVEIEALLSMGLANSPMATADIRVAGGTFIPAQPTGIIT